MEIQGYNISMIRGDTETIKISCKDAYYKGDIVIYEGKVYESLIDGNTWSPTDHPQGWEVIE